MRRRLACFAAICLPLLLGCASAPSPPAQPPVRIVEAPKIKVELFPQKPFEWALNISAVKDRQQLSKETQERVRAEKLDRACASITLEMLLIKGAQVYAALAPVLQKYGLSENREMCVEITYLSVPPQNVERLAPNWKFQSHTNSVTDITQYALLDPEAAKELIAKTSQEMSADILRGPCSFLDTQHGELVMGTQRGFIKDFEFVPDASGTQFRPQVGSLAYRWSLDLRAHVNPDKSLLLNLKGSLNTPWDLASGSGANIENDEIRLGYGPEAGVLPIQRPSPQVGTVEFNVQFAMQPNQTVLFTKNDLLFEKLGTNQKRQCLILAKVIPGPLSQQPLTPVQR